MDCIRLFIKRRQGTVTMMINQTAASCSPEIEKLIREMLAENARYERDLRSAHRENLVCPVSIILPDQQDVLEGFSRNISTAGICVMCDNEVPSGLRTTLEIYRLNSTASRIRAECRWCKPFGKRYYASGWQFLGVAR